MKIEIEVPEENNPFLTGKRKEQIQNLAKLEAKKLDKITQLAKCNLSDEALEKLVQLAKSPKAANMLIENWEFIQGMM